jgi:hypothetical protein
MPVTIDGTTGITTPAENTAALTVGSITGILKATSGVVSQAVAGTDYLVGGGSAITSTNTAKAWVNFDGTTSPGTIRSSYNVSSVTKNGNGNYTVNFTVGALADANYSWSGSTDGYLNSISGAYVNLGPTATYPIIKTTSNLRIIIQDQTGGLLNGSEISVQIFGN